MSPAALVASTEAGIAVARRDGAEWRVEVGREGWALALGTCGGRVYAGTKDGLHRSDDGGLTWAPSGLGGRRVTSVGCGPGVVYAGSKGPRLFCSEDGGDTWTELGAFHEARRWYWATPVSKPHREAEASAIAVSRRDPRIVVVGIEAGAVVRTTDGGRTWEGHRRRAVRDCHTLVPHPLEPGRMYEGGGSGAAYSRDDGRTWVRAVKGLGRARYGWAAAGDAEDPETRFLSAARGVRKAHGARPHSWVFRATGDEPWTPVLEADAMVYGLLATEDGLLAGLSDGRILATDDRGETWSELPFRFASIWKSLVSLP